MQCPKPHEGSALQQNCAQHEPSSEAGSPSWMPVPSPIRFPRAICGDLGQAERREWWIANGLGGYAGGTVAGSLTRRYHGLPAMAAACRSATAAITKGPFGPGSLDLSASPHTASAAKTPLQRKPCWSG